MKGVRVRVEKHTGYGVRITCALECNVAGTDAENLSRVLVQREDVVAGNCQLASRNILRVRVRVWVWGSGLGVAVRVRAAQRRGERL